MYTDDALRTILNRYIDSLPEDAEIIFDETKVANAGESSDKFTDRTIHIGSKSNPKFYLFINFERSARD